MTFFSTGLIFALGSLFCGLLLAPSTSFAAITSVTPVTWNIIGLDSNTPAFGPNRFPVGARICSSTAETNLPVNFIWDPATPNPFINLSGGSPNPLILPSIPAGGCADAYFEVEVQQTAAAFDTTRRYQITAGGVSTPTPRELYVEHLVSQARNYIQDLQFGTSLATLTSVPAGGSFSLTKDETYFIRLVCATATQGYEQLESFTSLPNTIFQILSVNSTYDADSSPNVNPPYDKLYGDACSWENDPNSPNYLACNSEGKIGGNITVTYQVKILDIGSGRKSISSLIHDFSGSSFHYNSDYLSGARTVNLIDPAAASITKKFSPTPIVSGGVSTLTITLSNPNGGAISNVGFIDTFPATTSSPPALGDMVVAPTPAISNSCGGILTDDGGGLLGAGDSGIKLGGGTIPAQSSCTIKVNVTAAAEDVYTNTTNNLIVGATDTGKTASAVLTIDNSAFPPPQPPSSCPGQEVELVRWNMNNGITTPPLYSSKASDVAAAPVTQASYSGTGVQAIDTTTPGTPNYSWKVTDGWPNSTTGFPNAAAPYFQFEIDTSKYGGVRLTFLHALFDNQGWGGTNRIYVYSSADGGAFSNIYNQLTTKNSWQAAITANALTTGSTSTIFRINATASNGTKTSDGLYLDDVIITGCAIPAVPPAPPTITKNFTPATVAAGGPSTLTFTIVNPNAASTLNKIAFEDILPAGLTVADATASACNGTNNLVTTASDGKIILTGGTLAGGASCTVSVTVTAASAGQHDNVSDAVTAAESGANTTTSGVATASLIALAPPTISKSFSPNPIFNNGIATLTFTITNPNSGNGLSDIAFTDTFPVVPAAMTVAAPLTTTNTCGAGVLQDDLGGTLTAGDAGIRLSGGTLAAGGSCTVSVKVTAPTAGTYNNSSGAVSHTLNAFTGNGNSAADSLWVETTSPGIALVKEVGPSATGPWTSFFATIPGATLYYHYTVENYGDVPLASVTVSDADPSANTASCNWANLPVAVVGNDNHIVECTSGPMTALAGSWQYPATAADNPMTASDTSAARYATAALSLVKSAVQAQFIAAGDILNYSFLVTNTGFAPLTPLSGKVTIADDKANDEDCPHVNTVGDFDNYFDPGESLTCTASYTVTADDVTARLVTNTATANAAGISSAPASRTVPLAPDLSVVKTNNVNGRTSDSGTFAWTLTVTNAATAGSATFAEGQVLLQDDLPDSGATYSVPATATNSTGTTGTIACAIAASTLTCTASGGAVTIPPAESFSIAITVNVTAAIVLANPRSPGLCQVDPTPVLAEIDEANNSCSNTVSAAMPSLLVVKSAQTYSDPINNTSSPKAIPGAFVTYTIQVINSGPGTVDADTTVVADAIPANTELFVGDIDGAGPATGPVLFTDGAGATASGLSYTFAGLASTTDNLAFSGDNGADLYAKSDTAPDGNECDPAVTNIRIPLSGIFNGSDGTNHPSFTVKFRVRIK